jgi:hypothetical protein
MPVGDANGTPFKIPATSTGGSGGATIVSGDTTSGTTAASAPAGDSGSTSQPLITKTYIGGGDDAVVFHNFTSGSTGAPALTTEPVHTAGFGVNASVFNALSSDTLVGAPWDGHFLVVSSDWDL